MGQLKKLNYPASYFNLSKNSKSSYNNNLAWRLTQYGHYKEGLIFIDYAIDLNPKNHYAYDTKATLKYYLLDYKNALIESDKSIEMDSEDGIKFYHRGYIHWEMNNNKLACKDWEKALELGFKKAEVTLSKFCK